MERFKKTNTCTAQTNKTHCQKVIGIIHTGLIGIADSLLTILRATGASLSTAYHPQSDGATEQLNQEIEAYLSIYSISNPENWSKTLSTLEFTHNN